MAQTTILTVQEIHCESCEHTISTALSSLAGVLRVSPDAATNQVKISYDESTLDRGRLEAALAEIGYPSITARPDS